MDLENLVQTVLVQKHHSTTDIHTRCRTYRTTTTNSIHRLSADEIRLVMQFLDRSSLIQFAGCSQRLLTDADSDAAWRHLLNTVHVCSKSETSVEDSFDGSRFHHCLDTKICWMYPEDDTITQPVLTIPRIRAFRLHASKLNLEQLQRLFHHASLRQVRSIIIDDNFGIGQVPVEVIDQLVGLLYLETLEINLPWRFGISFDSLVELLHLLSLVISLSGWAGAGSTLPPLPSLAFPAELKNLNIRVRGLLSDLLPPEVNLSSLERLTLEDVDGGEGKEEYYRTIFQGMRELSAVRLSCISNVQSILSALLVAPVLQTAQIVKPRPSPSVDFFRHLLSQPSVSPFLCSLSLPRIRGLPNVDPLSVFGELAEKEMRFTTMESSSY